MTIADCITAVRVRFEKWDHVPDQKKKEKRLDDVYILVEIIKILSGKKKCKVRMPFETKLVSVSGRYFFIFLFLKI